MQGQALVAAVGVPGLPRARGEGYGRRELKKEGLLSLAGQQAGSYTGDILSLTYELSSIIPTPQDKWHVKTEKAPNRDKNYTF